MEDNKLLFAKKLEEFIKNNINCEHEILIEKRPDKKTGLLKGMTRNYLTVITNSKDIKLFNTLAKVRIKRFENGKIFGELV